MYHIANDKRAHQSAEMTLQGLLKCMDSKSLAEVSVSDICREAKLSRPTFYRLFDSPTDVVRWGCDRTYEGLVSSEPEDASAFNPQLAMHYILSHSQAIECAVRNHRTDIVQASMARYLSPVLTHYLTMTECDSDPECLLSMMFGALSALLSAWVAGGRRQSEEDLIRSAREFSDILRKIISFITPSVHF